MPAEPRAKRGRGADGTPKGAKSGGSDDGSVKPCGKNVNSIPADRIDWYYAKQKADESPGDRLCLVSGCGLPYRDHPSDPLPVANAASAAGAGGSAAAAVGGERRSGLEKAVAKATDAFEATQRFHTTYRHAWSQPPPPVDIDRLLLYANTLHRGLYGCDEIVSSELPRSMTRPAARQPWDREEALADSCDVIRERMMAEVHLNVDNRRVKRSTLFVDGEGTMSYDECVEITRALGVLVIGLRALSRRDRKVFEARYVGAAAKADVPIAGEVVWFVAYRTHAISRLVSWLRALKHGRYPSRMGTDAAAAGGAAAASDASAFNIEAFAAEFPWAGVGAAVVARGGRDDPDAMRAAWNALAAAEVVASQGAKELTGESATATRKTPAATAGGDGGGDDGGGGGGGGGSGKSSRAQRRAAAKAKAKAGTPRGGGNGAGGARGKDRDGGGGDDGGGGATAGDAVSAARAVVARKAVGDITRSDCRAADLCFVCKRNYHGKTCSDKRGQEF